jgi:DNA repair exonuclease SbcCD ATPase subunit
MIRIRRLQAQNFKQLQEVELVLPRTGRFLVQGANESGKSTLFEAVFFGLFGRPLVTETGYQRLDDVIHYGADTAWVKLELEVPGGRRLRLARQVRRGRPNQWELEVVAADGLVEVVRSNNVVNERVAAELRLDGEALLNTCFVEQKKLEKLEGLGRREREQSLMKLLNLDRLVALEEALKVRPEDRAAVERLRQRAELARLRSELPELEVRLAEVTAELARHEVHGGLAAALAGVEALEALTERLAAARSEEAALAERLARVEALRAGAGRLKEARTAGERAREAAAEADRLATARAVAESARDEGLPAVTARGLALGRLKRRLALVDGVAAAAAAGARQVAEADARLSAAATERAELNRVRQDLVAARATTRDAASALEALAHDERAFDVRDTLQEWLAARAALTAAPEPEGSLAAARAEQDAANRHGRLELAGLGGIAIAVLMVWRLVAPAWQPGLWWLVAAVAGLALAWRWAVVGRRERARAADVGRIEGEAAGRARERAAMTARSEAALARLVALNVVCPADDVRGARAVAELDARLVGRSRTDVAAELGTTRQAVARAEAQVEALIEQERRLRETAGRFDAAALGRERDALAAAVARRAAFAARWRPRLTTQAAELAVALEAGAIEGELGGLRGEVRALRAEVERIPTLAAEQDTRLAAAAGHRRTAAVAWAEVPAVPGLPPWSGDMDDAVWRAAEQALARAYAAAGGDGVRLAAEAATRAAARLFGEHASQVRAQSQLLAEVRSRAAQAGLALTLADGADQATLSAAAAAVAGTLFHPMDSLDRDRAALTEQVSIARHEASRLERLLGLSAEVLDLAAEATAYAAAARDLAVRERSAELVAHSGRNVVQRVLPSTIEHMRRLLPALTDGRYFDAELTDDYRIQVLDERAGTWKQKNIFSGGTKDQFSLALRLAFALATLPEERGAAPSFLFLDEPLGAFDDSRARALVELLTTGEIAASFDQVFLISHVRVDESLFDYQITLAGGRVVESNLPVPAEVPAGSPLG